MGQLIPAQPNPGDTEGNYTSIDVNVPQNQSNLRDVRNSFDRRIL